MHIITCRNFILAIMMALVCGCSGKPKVSGLWFFTYSSARNPAMKNNLSPTSFINLQENGQYTRDFGSFEYGTWKWSDNAIEITNQLQKTYKLPVNYFSS